MDADVVYSIAKALPKKEQLALLNMLQKDIHVAQGPNRRRKIAQNFTDEQAIEYLLQTVFNSKK